MIYLLIFLIILAVISFLGLVLVFSFLLAILKGAPYIATDKKKIKSILNLANIKEGHKAVDLGSGDGRLVIALANQGAEVHGYEINPFLVWYSRWRIKKAGLSDSAFVHKKNFWNVDMQPFDVIVVFGIGNIMEKLEAKLESEAKDSLRVVSNGFLFPSWDYTDKEGQIFLYKK